VNDLAFPACLGAGGIRRRRGADEPAPGCSALS